MTFDFTYFSFFDINTMINNIIIGFSVGIGSGLANYFVIKFFISKVEKLEKRLEGKKQI